MGKTNPSKISLSLVELKLFPKTRQSRSPPLAISHAKRSRAQRYTRPNQGISVEDAQERTGRSWVRISLSQSPMFFL